MPLLLSFSYFLFYHKIFILDTPLEYLKGVGDSREAMIQFAHYVEALVAYHRYLGGRDN